MECSDIKVNFLKSLTSNYIWIISHKNSNNVIVVDPGESEQVKFYLSTNKLNLAAIFITHNHYDHTGGVIDLIKNYDGINIWGPKNDSLNFPYNPLCMSDTVDVTSMSLQFKVIDIPGHSLGHIAFYGYDSLFCGDTLFAAGMGKIFEGTAAQMFNSINLITSLPPTTKIYCGHEYTTDNLRFAMHVEPDNTAISRRYNSVLASVKRGDASVPSSLANEYMTNPFLRYNNDDVINAVVKHFSLDSNSVNDLTIFTKLREWKDNFS